MTQSKSPACFPPECSTSVTLVESRDTVHRQEMKWVVMFAILVVGITCLPYLLGYFNQGDEWRFTGFVMGLEDGNSYIAKMLTGSFGAWLFYTPYSGVDQTGVLAFFPYILLGKLASHSNLHLELVVLFHGYRIVASLMDILITYRFISLFIKIPFNRRIALIVAILGGGLGWILLIFHQSGGWLDTMPLDFYSPETFGFLSVLVLPHLALARVCLLGGLTIYLSSGRPGISSAKERAISIFAGLIWLVLGLAQPVTLVIGWYVIVLHLMITLVLSKYNNGLIVHGDPWITYIRRGIWMIAISCPLIIYSGYKFLTDPYLIAWTQRNEITSPSLIHYLFAYILLLPLAIMGAKRFFRDDPWKTSFLVGWLASFPILAYAPFAMQRRLPEAIWVVIVILAVEYFLNCPNRWRSRLLSIFMLTLPSTLILLILCITYVSKPGAPLYLPISEARVFEYVGETADPNSRVFTSYDIGNHLPAWAPVRVLAGHGPEGVNGEQAMESLTQFLTEMTERERWELLHENQIDYVLLGPEEMEIITWDPGQIDGLEQVYSDSGYMVLKIIRDSE